MLYGGKARLLNNLYIWQRVGMPTPVAWWQPMAGGAWNPTSLAESYINVSNPGTYNAAEGTPPAWAANTGWTWNGAMFLLTGLVPSAGWSILSCFRSFAGTGGTAIGLGILAQNKRFYLRPRSSTVARIYGYGNNSRVVNPGALSSGTMALCAGACYLDGVSDGATGGIWTNTTAQLLLGAENSADPGPTASVNMTGITTLHAVWNTDISSYLPALQVVLLAEGIAIAAA